MGENRLWARVLSEANSGIVGINEDLDVFGGYDEQFTFDGLLAPSWSGDDDDYVPPTVEDKRALAEHMIALWKKFGGISTSSDHRRHYTQTGYIETGPPVPCAGGCAGNPRVEYCRDCGVNRITEPQ
jgi:hypothetical protein